MLNYKNAHVVSTPNNTVQLKESWGRVGIVWWVVSCFSQKPVRLGEQFFMNNEWFSWGIFQCLLPCASPSSTLDDSAFLEHPSHSVSSSWNVPLPNPFSQKQTPIQP